MASQCPVIADEWEDPDGVPISAILVGGRRASVVPLVNESRDWQHGTFLASIIGSEKTAAADGAIGDLRRDPMAMLPFCGYNMADYWSHWLSLGEKQGAQMPKIYYTNWFRKNAAGKFIWPGFGENSRILKWIFERCDGSVGATETPIGNLPREEDLDFDGLEMDAETTATLLSVDVEGWLSELPSIREYYAGFAGRTPAALMAEVDSLEAGLKKAS